LAGVVLTVFEPTSLAERRKKSFFFKLGEIAENRFGFPKLPDLVSTPTIKQEVNESRKQKLQCNRSTETALRLLVENNYHREAALAQDSSQWTGQNRLLLSPQDIIRLDAVDRLHDSTND
jgi:hypothetical protein